jgi:hypothetical protein
LSQHLIITYYDIMKNSETKTIQHTDKQHLKKLSICKIKLSHNIKKILISKDKTIQLGKVRAFFIDIEGFFYFKFLLTEKLSVVKAELSVFTRSV